MNGLMAIEQNKDIEYQVGSMLTDESKHQYST